MDSRRLGRAPGSRAALPLREPVRHARVSLGAPANDNGAPLSARLLEAGRWLALLVLLIGLAAYLVR